MRGFKTFLLQEKTPMVPPGFDDSPSGPIHPLGKTRELKICLERHHSVLEPIWGKNYVLFVEHPLELTTGLLRRI